MELVEGFEIAVAGFLVYAVQGVVRVGDDVSGEHVSLDDDVWSEKDHSFFECFLFVLSGNGVVLGCTDGFGVDAFDVFALVAEFLIENGDEFGRCAVVNGAAEVISGEFVHFHVFDADVGAQFQDLFGEDVMGDGAFYFNLPHGFGIVCLEFAVFL